MSRSVPIGAAWIASVACALGGPGVARADGAAEFTATFSVLNTNTSRVPCSSDERPYDLKGRVALPAAVVSTSHGSAVTLYVHSPVLSERTEWTTITAPVLLVYGEQDRILSWPATERQRLHFAPTTDVKVTCLAGTGHMLPLHPTRTRLYAELAGWLANHVTFQPNRQCTPPPTGRS